MTREEARSILNRYDMNFYDTNGIRIGADTLAEAFDMAIEALQDGWIPVSEGLPEDGYWLWSAKGGEVKKDFYYRGHWEIAEDFGYEVIAWKPLPKPYKGSDSKWR